MASLVWLGALLGVLASMTGTAGKQLLRFSEIQRQKGTKASLCLAKAAFASGLGLNTIVGPIIDMGSYAFAPQSVIAPLGGLDVVWNTLSAPCTLGETLTPLLVIGCAFIGGGATATSLFGSHEEKDFTPELIKDTFFRWVVLFYLLFLSIWLAFNVLVLIPRSAAPKGEEFKTGDKLRGLSLGMTAGSIAGNMFCVKAFVEILQASIRDGKPEYWADWLPYVLLLGAVFFATSNLYFLTKAMEEYEALFMGAVFEGSLIVSACISGCVVFGELDGLKWWEICLYWLAVSSIVLGICTVAYGSTCTDITVDKTTEAVEEERTENGDALELQEDIKASSVVDDPTSKPSTVSIFGGTCSARDGELSPFRGVPVAYKMSQTRRSTTSNQRKLAADGADETSTPGHAWN